LESVLKNRTRSVGVTLGKSSFFFQELALKRHQEKAEEDQQKSFLIFSSLNVIASFLGLVISLTFFDQCGDVC